MFSVGLSPAGGGLVVGEDAGRDGSGRQVSSPQILQNNHQNYEDILAYLYTFKDHNIA